MGFLHCPILVVGSQGCLSPARSCGEDSSIEGDFSDRCVFPHQSPWGANALRTLHGPGISWGGRSMVRVASSQKKSTRVFYPADDRNRFWFHSGALSDADTSRKRNIFAFCRIGHEPRGPWWRAEKTYRPPSTGIRRRRPNLTGSYGVPARPGLSARGGHLPHA